MALILPIDVPTTIVSPTSSLPLWTNTDAIGPFALSSLASITAPLACLFGFTFRSCISETRSTISSNWSMFIFCFADISTNTVFPPHSSGTNSYCINSCFTLSGLAPGTSILFIATIIGIPAAFAWFIASTVWGITPSSAATTSIATSVIWAPLARMLVNASCPGVSKKVISLPFIVTL